MNNDIKGFPGSSEGKDSACSAGDTADAALIPGLERFPREGNASPLQYSCLGNPMDRGNWQATVHGDTKNLMKLSKLNNNNRMIYNQSFPDDSSGKDSACSAGDTGEANSSPELERSPGVGSGSPLQNSSLENPMD